MEEKSDPELVCKLDDGLYDPDNEECQNCFWKARRVCSLFTVEMGRMTQAEIMLESAIRKKERQNDV